MDFNDTGAERGLRPMLKYAQFICTNNNKQPVNPVTGELIDSQNPVNHMDFATAFQSAMIGGFDVAFVLMGKEPFFCIDLDGTGPEHPIVGMFPQAYIERSRSGNGVHIFGAISPDVVIRSGEHLTRAKDVGEFYTSGRYIILGGVKTSKDNHGGVIQEGSASANCDMQVISMLEKYFPRRSVAAASGVGAPRQPGTGPIAAWCGPESDDELLDIAFRMVGGPQSAFGAKASFAQLWEGDAAVLGTYYPTSTLGEPFDHSSADASLMAYLAFLTGKDPERMERLFARSVLAKRDKWQLRDDYRQRTIQGANNIVQVVYSNDKYKKKTEHSLVVGLEEQAQLFSGAIYIADRDRILMPSGELYTPQQFKHWFAGPQYETLLGNNTLDAFKAFMNNPENPASKAQSTMFRPDHPPGVHTYNGAICANTYNPKYHGKMTPGDVTPFLELLKKQFPDPNDLQIIISYMAACIQHKGVKFQWAPVIQGAQGNGKTFLVRCLEYAMGEKYCHTLNARDLDGNAAKFTGWLEGKLIIAIEELFVGDNFGVAEALKPLITNTRIEIQRKGIDQAMGDNLANFIITTNHRDALIATHDDRRYAAFFTKHQTVDDLIADGLDGSYFYNLWNWARAGGFEIIHWYLANVTIPDALNPAIGAQRAPRTSSHFEAMRASLPRGALEIADAIESETPGMMGKFVSTAVINQVLKERGINAGPRAIEKWLRQLDYKLLGRSTKAIFQQDMKKPRIYCHASIYDDHTGAGADWFPAYMAAQNYA